MMDDNWSRIFGFQNDFQNDIMQIHKKLKFIAHPVPGWGCHPQWQVTSASGTRIDRETTALVQKAEISRVLLESADIATLSHDYYHLLYYSSYYFCTIFMISISSIMSIIGITRYH